MKLRNAVIKLTAKESEWEEGESARELKKKKEDGREECEVTQEIENRTVEDEDL